MPTQFRPRLIAPLPDGWYAKESITLLTPDGQGNVIASSEPLDPEIDTQRYAAVQGEVLHKEFPGFHEFSLEEIEIFGGRPGQIRRFEWTPPDGVPVTQIQLYYAEPGRGYTATATSPSTESDRFELDFLDVLEGLLINDVNRASDAV